ncbi:hypothetical protein BH10BAC4_BH10BAC4_22440 [soil metagenome]
MHFQSISTKVLEMLLLEACISVIPLIIMLLAPMLPDETIRIFVLNNIKWIGNAILGLIICSVARKMGWVAVAIGLVTIPLPLIGPIFYLMASLQNQQPNVKQQPQ